MTERFKLVNKSRVNNNRVRLIKTNNSTVNIDPLFGAIYNDDAEIGLCLSPYTIIGCVGAEPESEVMTIDGDGWAVEVDGILHNVPHLSFDNMVTVLESLGVRVTLEQPAVLNEIICDGAVSEETLDMDEGKWKLEVDGIDMGGPFTLEELDAQTRRREVRVKLPEPLYCDPTGGPYLSFYITNQYGFGGLYNAFTLERLLMSFEMSFIPQIITKDIVWKHDQLTGAGMLMNRTNECLLLRMPMSDNPFSVININNYADNGLVSIDGNDLLVSLAPAVYDTPTINVGSFVLLSAEDEEAVYGPASDHLDKVTEGNVYIGISVAGDIMPPGGINITYLDQSISFLDYDGIYQYIKLENIAPNNGLGRNYYVYRNDIIVDIDSIISLDTTTDYDVVQESSHWDNSPAPYGLTLGWGSESYDLTSLSRYSGFSNVDAESYITVPRNTPITLQFDPVFAGGYIMKGSLMTNDYVNKLGVIDSTGKVTFTFDSATFDAGNVSDLNIYDPNTIDETELGTYKKRGFSNIATLTLT